MRNVRRNITDRCWIFGCFERCWRLARSVRGSNQADKIIKGVDIESVPKEKVREWEIETEWCGNKKIVVKKAKEEDWVNISGHRIKKGDIIEVTKIPREKSVKVNIVEDWVNV